MRDEHPCSKEPCRVRAIEATPLPREVAVSDLAAAGDRVTTRHRFVGKLDGPVRHAPATGETVEATASGP